MVLDEKSVLVMSPPHTSFSSTSANVESFTLDCGHDTQDADNNFRSYLVDYQTVAARFKPTLKQN